MNPLELQRLVGRSHLSAREQIVAREAMDELEKKYPDLYFAVYRIYVEGRSRSWMGSRYPFSRQTFSRKAEAGRHFILGALFGAEKTVNQSFNMRPGR